MSSQNPYERNPKFSSNYKIDRLYDKIDLNCTNYFKVYHAWGIKKLSTFVKNYKHLKKKTLVLIQKNVILEDEAKDFAENYMRVVIRNDKKRRFGFNVNLADIDEISENSFSNSDDAKDHDDDDSKSISNSRSRSSSSKSLRLKEARSRKESQVTKKFTFKPKLSTRNITKLKEIKERKDWDGGKITMLPLGQILINNPNVKDEIKSLLTRKSVIKRKPMMRGSKSNASPVINFNRARSESKQLEEFTQSNISNERKKESKHKTLMIKANKKLSFVVKPPTPRFSVKQVIED